MTISAPKLSVIGKTPPPIPALTAGSVIEFNGSGAPVRRRFGVPFLQGMDEIAVRNAEIAIETMKTVVTVPVDASMRRPSPAAGVVVLDLGQESRLVGLRLGVSGTWPLAAPRHLVIRAVASGGAGPALFSLPAGTPPQELPGGISETADRSVAFPALTGRSWSIQLTGIAPTETFDVTHVVLDRAPRDLSVTVGGDPILIHGGTRLAEQGEHSSDLVALAERLLGEALPGGNLALPVAFVSAAAARVRVVRARLEATFTARPALQPLRVALRGSGETVSLDVPAGLRPAASSVRLTARAHARELNGAYPIADTTPSSSALRVSPVRSAAASAALAPLSGAAEGTLLGLAAVRIFLLARGEAEVAMDVRGAEAAAPGTALAKPLVQRLPAGFRGWLDFPLPSPVALATGPAACWIVLRATKGEVLWCSDASEAGSALASEDGGATWSEPSQRLTSSFAPRLQLFHATVLPPAARIEVRAGDATAQWTLQQTAAGSRELGLVTSLPPSLLAQFARTRGSGRAPVSFTLASRLALDLTLDRISLTYDDHARGSK